MAYANIKKCGLYQDGFWKWSHETRLKKTWSNLKAHFARAFKGTQRSSRPSKTQGYASNVQSKRANVALFTNMQQSHTMELANLTTATQVDRTLVVLLKKTITEISFQVTTLTAKLATEKSENTHLKISGHRSASANHRH